MLEPAEVHRAVVEVVLVLVVGGASALMRVQPHWRFPLSLRIDRLEVALVVCHGNAPGQHRWVSHPWSRQHTWTCPFGPRQCFKACSYLP